MILEFKRNLKDHDTKVYPKSLSAKTTMNIQRELSELMETSTTYLNQTISEIYRTFIKIKLPWIWLLTNSNV